MARHSDDEARDREEAKGPSGGGRLRGRRGGRQRCRRGGVPAAELHGRRGHALLLELLIQRGSRRCLGTGEPQRGGEKSRGARLGKAGGGGLLRRGKVRKKGTALEHCGRATTATTPLPATSHGPTQGRLSRGTEWPAARVACSFSLSGDGTRKRGIGTRERSRGVVRSHALLAAGKRESGEDRGDRAKLARVRLGSRPALDLGPLVERGCWRPKWPGWALSLSPS